jgi:hypothetical protein
VAAKAPPLAEVDRPGPLLAVLLVQLYFFAMICWWTQFNPGRPA